LRDVTFDVKLVGVIYIYIYNSQWDNYKQTYRMVHI
jgi:hypothetical protein